MGLLAQPGGTNTRRQYNYFRKSNQTAADNCPRKMVRTARTLGRPLKMPDGRIELRYLLVPEDRDAVDVIAARFLTMLAEGVYLKRKPRWRLPLK